MVSNSSYVLCFEKAELQTSGLQWHLQNTQESRGLDYLTVKAL